MSEPSRPKTETTVSIQVEGSLPIGLWLGTAVFALLSAGALVVGMRMGRAAVEGSSTVNGAKALESDRADGEGRMEAAREAALASAGPAAGRLDRRKAAAERWNAGVLRFQKKDYRGAREEWTACAKLDPDHADCRSGLARLERR